MSPVEECVIMYGVQGLEMTITPQRQLQRKCEITYRSNRFQEGGSENEVEERRG